MQQYIILEYRKKFHKRIGVLEPWGQLSLYDEISKKYYDLASIDFIEAKKLAKKSLESGEDFLFERFKDKEFSCPILDKDCIY